MRRLGLCQHGRQALDGRVPIKAGALLQYELLTLEHRHPPRVGLRGLANGGQACLHVHQGPLIHLVVGKGE